MSESPTSSEETANVSSGAHIASDGDEQSSNSSPQSEASPAGQVEEVLRVESEPLDDIPPAAIQVDSKKPERTPLPSGREKSSSTSSAADGKTTNINRLYRVAKRGSKWTSEENALLQQLKSQGKSWAEIIKELPGRSVTACMRHHAQTARKLPPAGKGSSNKASAPPKSRSKTMWKSEEIDTLVKLRKRGVSWKKIGDQLPGRTISACRRKSETLMKGEDIVLETRCAAEYRPDEASTDDEGEDTNDSDEDLSDGDADLANGVEGRVSRGFNGDKEIEDCNAMEMSGSSSEDSPVSESENEIDDKAERTKRKHKMFYVHQ